MSASPPASPGPAPNEPAENQELFNDIFGGEDSDLSDDEDNARPAARKSGAGGGETIAGPASAAASSPGAGASGAAQQDESEDEADAGARDHDDDDEEEGEQDAYVPGTVNTPSKIPKFKKTKRVDREEGDEDAAGAEDGEDGDEERRKKKKRRKEKRDKQESRRRDHAEEDEEEAAVLPVYDEATQRRMAIEERIDSIGKKAAKPTRRRKKGEEDVVDTYHDEICVRLRERMIMAADKDRKSNENKMPATAKLAMLDEVMGILRNAPLWQPIVDNGVLEAVRAWLEPMYPSGALPAVGIQNAMFEVLPKMDLDTTTLKEARLGPIVLFYTKTKRVTPAINRQADALVQAWSRPIIKRPANFRSKHFDSVTEVEMRAERSGERGNGDGGEDGGAGAGGDDDMEGMEESQSSQPTIRKNKRFDARAAAKANEGRKGAMRPVPREVQYTVAPESRGAARDNHEHTAKLQLDNRKFNKFVRQMRPGSKAK